MREFLPALQSFDSTKRYNRRSIRLKEFDYSSTGEYFVTICVKNKECLLGEIADEDVRLSSLGKIARQCWEEMPKHFDSIELDTFVIMPNHLHGIIIIHPFEGVEYIQPNIIKSNVGVQNFEPLQNKYQHVVPKSLGSIIRAYKSAVTREYCKLGYNGSCWQRNYYEHIICSDKDLNNIREYIINNPLKWFTDNENPLRAKKLEL